MISKAFISVFNLQEEIEKKYDVAPTIVYFNKGL